MLLQIAEKGGFHAKCQDGIDHSSPTVQLGKDTVYRGGKLTYEKWREHEVDEPSDDGAQPIDGSLRGKFPECRQVSRYDEVRDFLITSKLR